MTLYFVISGFQKLPNMWLSFHLIRRWPNSDKHNLSKNCQSQTNEVQHVCGANIPLFHMHICPVSMKLSCGDTRNIQRWWTAGRYCVPNSARRDNWTHWGRLTHICVGNLIIIGSDNSLSPGQRQAIIWTSAGILLIWPLWGNFSEILVKIDTFSFKKMHLKMSSEKWWPSCPGLNMLMNGRN